MAGFTPAEEVERILMAPKEMAEKAVRDFFREEWVEAPGIAMLTEVLVVVVVVVVVVVAMDMEEAVEAEEDTLVEAVELIRTTPVGEGEVPTMMEQINKTIVATTQLVMVM